MNIKKAIKTYIFILLFLVFSLTFLFNNKTIDKEITSKNYGTKALDQEGQNYRLVTSADNVQVPVPKGYVASGVTGENYVTPEYQHTTNTYKVESTPTVLTWSSPAGEQYPWTQDENGIWISGNQGIPNSTSTLESEEFDYVKGTTLTINYTYSSQGWYDYFNIDLINVNNNTTQRIVNDRAGNTSDSFDYTTSNYTYTMNDWATGRYKIKAIYSKNWITDEGQDSSYIKTSTYYKKDENGTQTFEDDIKTKIHDGGFVIYQLTDEEIETDPNGTSVLINDTNKDTAQSTRNQYVWVPIPNIEDIVRTKEKNNGIMQFGQSYSFSNTSINKNTDIWESSYHEPRLAKQYDKTKFYLQKSSKINKRENYLKNMQEEYSRMIESINKYKGFYIGRYETGDDYTHSSSQECFKNPRIVRYNSNISNVTWYNSYKDLERLSGKTEEYVETGMIHDSLFDYTLIWLNETDTRSYKYLAVDSGTWGNYRNNILKYKESANGTESTKNINSIKKTPTGGVTEITFNGEKYINFPTASNNIFDIAGNIKELTRAYLTSGSYTERTNRGGTFEYDSNRSNYASIIDDYYPYLATDYVGVRAQLYIL